MSHMITRRDDGFFEFGYCGKPAWHGLGQEFDENTPLEEIRVKCGLDWTAETTKILFSTPNTNVSVYPKRQIIYRSDNNKPLSIVSDQFKIVQPEEVLEFFRDLVGESGMHLSAAGSLFGGTRFWATAEVGNVAEAMPGDKLNNYLLLTTSVDGSLATTAKLCSTRTVCNNTLNIAMNEKTKDVVRKSHRSLWVANDAKLDLGLISESWEVFMNNIKTLTAIPMTDSTVRKFFEEEFFDHKKEAKDQTWGAIKRVNSLMNLYHDGAGANMGINTAWGALNAVTNLFTHGDGRKRDQSNIFWDGYHGTAANIKTRVFDNLLKMAA